MFARKPSNIDGMRQLAKQVGAIRWFVVLALFTFVFGFEVVEHVIVEKEAINWRLTFEVLFLVLLARHSCFSF